MSLRNTLFGIVTLYSGLAFAQPKDALQEYTTQATQAVSAAQAVVERSRDQTLNVGCVDAIDLIASFEDGAQELSDLYGKIAADKKNPTLVDLNTKVNVGIAQANQILGQYFRHNCGFCSGLDREQCGDLDDYVNNLQAGIANADRITPIVDELSCVTAKEVYAKIHALNQTLKGLESDSQESEGFIPGYKGIVTLAGEKGFSDFRDTYWQKMNDLERELKTQMNYRCGERK